MPECNSRFQATTYWQRTSNWKKSRFRNSLFSSDLHRGTHLGCVTRFRDSWAISRLFGRFHQKGGPAICGWRLGRSDANPYIRLRNEEGSLGLTNEPSCNRDGLCNPTEWRRPPRLTTGLTDFPPFRMSVSPKFLRENSHQFKSEWKFIS